MSTSLLSRPLFSKTSQGSFLLFGLLGLLSGIATPFLNQVVLYAPGIVFGIALTVAFLLTDSYSRKLIVFLPLSIVAWIASFFSARLIMISPSLTYIVPVISGFVGGFVIFFGIHIFYKKASLKKILYGAFITGLLGLSLYTPVGFVVWQTGAALMLVTIFFRPRGLNPAN